MQGTRTEGGAQVYNRGNSARAVLQCLKKGELVGILPDQNAADVFVPFFGLSTGTTNGPAVLHLRTGAPLVCTWCTRKPDGSFHILFEEPLEAVPGPDREQDVLAVMTEINRRLEAQIRRQPSQWLWLHDRWRASPHVFQNKMDSAQ